MRRKAGQPRGVLELGAVEQFLVLRGERACLPSPACAGAVYLWRSLTRCAGAVLSSSRDVACRSATAAESASSSILEVPSCSSRCATSSTAAVSLMPTLFSFTLWWNLSSTSMTARCPPGVRQ